ncbi:hypothetical protein EJ04DRAFT_516096 [Polyplosphaeria fusca]|uniref:Transmembrane protein n=1 Tax=Polyplosphaeria fusca TaxID=682080 RepID=A0A9P4UXT3_9PLEO|nr:hypothetical protein EJ04DRAFT_516096 [Polyplosphaeria fusca]
MAEATIQSSMSERNQYSSIHPDDDALSQALRAPGDISMAQLVQLTQQAPSSVASSSVGTRSSAVFTSQDPSTGTMPTSGKGYNFNDKGNAFVMDAAKGPSSLSATDGSGGEWDEQKEQDIDFAGFGSWADEDRGMQQPLRRAENSRRRPLQNRLRRAKKPPVVIHQGHRATASLSEDESVVEHAVQGSSHDGDDQCPRRPRKEEVERSSQSPANETLGRARVYTVLALILAIFLTFSTSAFCAVHHTGKQRMACTEGVVFVATVLISGLIVLAMSTARWALHTALLAGLFAFAVGSVLLFKLPVFMHA